MAAVSDELTQRGLAALVRELGSEDAYRFLQTVRTHQPEDFLRPLAMTSPSPPGAPVGTSADASPAIPLTEAGVSTSPRAPQSLTGTQLTLFSPDLQPWSAPLPADAAKRNIDARDTLLAQLANSELGSTELRVAYILQRFPETRDSDTALAIRSWARFQADLLEKWPNTDLDILYELQSIETISRIRRHIQNDLNLFQGRPRTSAARNEIQREFYQYMREARRGDPEIRFYLDETGNEPSTRLTGVAGICVLDWRQYQKHHAALSQARDRLRWPSTLRFANLDARNTGIALKLLTELHQRRGGLLFIAHTIASRGRTHPYLVDLFIQLTIDAVRHMARNGCLTDLRSLTLIKEADEGFDAIYLQTLEHELARQLAREFPDLVYVRAIQPLPKGSDVFLECADLIAGGFQRRLLSGGRNPKDEFAEAVMNVTGFEDPLDAGAVIRMHGH